MVTADLPSTLHSRLARNSCKPALSPTLILNSASSIGSAINSECKQFSAASTGSVYASGSSDVPQGTTNIDSKSAIGRIAHVSRKPCQLGLQHVFNGLIENYSLDLTHYSPNELIDNSGDSKKTKVTIGVRTRKNRMVAAVFSLNRVETLSNELNGEHSANDISDSEQINGGFSNVQ